MKKVGAGIIAVVALLLLSTVVLADDAFNPLHGGGSSKGSITVCKIIIDSQGNVVDGSSNPGTLFSISGFTPSPTPSTGAPVGQFGTANFDTPILFDEDLLDSVPGDDAECVLFDNLDLGGYYYTEETINGQGWEAPLYNDQFTVAVTTLNDFFPYDGKLFDGNPGNDGSRNKNVDGHIVLNSDRRHRTLIVLNQLEIIPQGECECDGGVRTITMRYDGAQNGVTVKVYNDKNGNDESKVIATFNNVNNGDELFVDGSGLDNGKFKSNIFWKIVSGSGVKVHVSCSQPLFIGQQFGSFTLVNMEDRQGKVCVSNCGNGEIDQGEECDGGNDAACPGLCNPPESFNECKCQSDEGRTVCELDVERGSHEKVESIHIETTNTDPNLNTLWNTLWGVNPGILVNLFLQQDTVLVWEEGTLVMGGSIKAELTQVGSLKKLKLKKDGAQTTFVSGTGGVNPQLDAGGWHRVEIEEMDNVVVEFDSQIISGLLKKLKVKLSSDSTTVANFELEIIGTTASPLNSNFKITNTQIDVPETRITAFQGREYEEKIKPEPVETNGHTEAESKSSTPTLANIFDLNDGNNNNLEERDGPCVIKTGCQTNADCDDDVECTIDVCNTQTGECSNTPDNSFCDNGDACDGDEFCDPELDCQLGTPVICDDQNDCTIDTCDPFTGECSFDPPFLSEIGLCNDQEDNDCDGLVDCEDPDCFSDPACAACLTNEDCNDNNICTADVCDQQFFTCSFTPVADCCNINEDCDDENACTEDICLEDNTCINEIAQQNDPDGDGVPSGPSPGCCI